MLLAVQLFTPEKRDTVTFHIMTKEIYPHSVLTTQSYSSNKVVMKPVYPYNRGSILLSSQVMPLWHALHDKRHALVVPSLAS